MEKNITKYTELEQKLRAKVIEKTLTVRGEGYQIHIEEIFLELFGLHDEFFVNQYGFTPETVLKIINHIEDEVKANQILVKEEHRAFVRWFGKQDLNRLARQYGSGDPFLPSRVYQIETGHRPKFKDIQDQFKFVESNLDNQQINILRTLSQQFGENGSFLNPRFSALPLNDTLISSRPIIHDKNSNSYYCFSSRILHRNMFSIAEGLIEQADKTYNTNVYRSKKQIGKSSYFEDKVHRLLKRIMPSYPMHVNLKYGVDDEMDILINAKNHTYLNSSLKCN